MILLTFSYCRHHNLNRMEEEGESSFDERCRLWMEVRPKSLKEVISWSAIIRESSYPCWDFLDCLAIWCQSSSSPHRRWQQTSLTGDSTWNHMKHCSDKEILKKIIGRLLVSLAVFDSTFIVFIVFDFTLVRSK